MKGQITVFLLVAVLLVGGFFFYVSQNAPDVALIAQEEVAPHKQEMLTCFQNLVEEMYRLAQLQGGLINPLFYRENGFYKEAYFKQDELVLIPTVDIIEEQFTTYVSENIPRCAIQNASTLTSLEVVLYNSSLFVSVVYPQEVVFGDATVTLDGVMNYVVPSTLVRDLSLSYDVLDTDFLSFDFLVSYNITVLYDYDAFVYVINDSFIFLEQHDYVNLSRNTPPLLQLEPLYAQAGSVFNYTFNVTDLEGDAISMHVITPLFSIEGTGFSFIPEEVGDYAIPLYVSDGKVTTLEVLELHVN